MTKLLKIGEKYDRNKKVDKSQILKPHTGIYYIQYIYYRSGA